MNLKDEVENAAYGSGYVALAAAVCATVMAAVTAVSVARALRRRHPRANRTSTGK